MSTPIEQVLKAAMILQMANMTKANGYRYDVGTINEFELSASTFPRYMVTWGRPVPQEKTDGTLTERFRQRYMQIYGQWKNTGDISEMSAITEAEKMAEDIKRLVGKPSFLGSASEVYYVGCRRVFSNDKTYPIAIKAELLVRYWQLRKSPETAG